MSRHYQTLKGGMNRFRNAENTRLKQLTLNSGSCMADLDNKIQLGSRILRLAQLNRKMETEQEKVVPFHKPIVDVDEDGEGAQVGGKVKDGSTVPGGDGQITEGKVWLCAYGTDEAGGELEEWDYFHRFHQRFNKVTLDRAAIEKEKDRLGSENADLRTILKQYLDGISVNEDVINNPGNPLVILNSKLRLTAPSAAAPQLQYEYSRAQ